jgi:hypothetical protein
MFKTRLYWFANEEGDTSKQVERSHTTESSARSFAVERATMVSGGCYVMRGESIVGHYKTGEDVMAVAA